MLNTLDYIKRSIKQCLQAAEKAIEKNDICELAENIGQFQAYAHSLDILLISDIKRSGHYETI